MSIRRTILAALLLALAGCGDGGPQPPRAGDAMAPFTATALSGERFDLPAAAAGKVVVLTFWASWCAPCKSEMTAIEPVWRAEQGRGLLVVAVNAGQKAEDIAAFVTDLGVTYPVLLDPESQIVRTYGVTGLPTLFLIDRQGRIHSRVLGQTDETAFRKMVEGLL